MDSDNTGRTLLARFEGPGVAEGRVSVPEFVTVLENLQRSLIIVGEDILGRRHTRGRVPQAFTTQLTLDLVSTSSGSFQAVLELHRPGQPDLENIGEEALEALLEGIESEVGGGPSDLPLPARPLIRNLAARVSGDIAKLTLVGGRGRRTVVITPEIMPAPVPEGQPPHRLPARVVGRLLEVDFKDGTAEVWDATGKMTRLMFSAEMADHLKAAARMQVIAEGDAEFDEEGRVRSLELKDLGPVTPQEEFWANLGPEELARQQGIKPLASLEQLRIPSLADEDADDLIRELRRLRSAAR